MESYRKWSYGNNHDQKVNVIIPKPEALWDENDEKNYAYDWKGRNMLIAALGVDEYFRVSH